MKMFPRVTLLLCVSEILDEFELDAYFFHFIRKLSIILIRVKVLF